MSSDETAQRKIKAGQEALIEELERIADVT